ncbi:MAG: ABC transporter ATP-binding protein/permease [Anaerolineae bacterium]|nr:ABC transporter ATP-binding protein/permease [Anaerolineae bacterium]
MEPSMIDLKETVTKRKVTGFWRLMAGYRLIYFVAIVCVGLSAIARSGLYYVLGKFVDEILPSENLNQQLIWVVLVLLALALMQGYFSYAGGRLAAKSSEGIARRLRNYLYDHLQRFTFSYHDRAQTGDLLARSTSDVDAVRRMFAEQLIGIGRIGLLFVVNFIALLLLNVPLALFSVAVIPVIMIISVYFFVKVGKAYEAFQEQESRLSNQLQENLTGVRVVKAFARQEYEIDAFEKENMDKFQKGRKLTIMHSFYWPSTDFILGIQMVAGFYVAALMVLDGTLTVGMYIAYVGFLVQIIWPIRNLGRLIADISTGSVSFGRIQELIKVDQENLDTGSYRPTGRIKGALSFNNMSFRYEGEDEDVLHNISFSVKPGQKIALMGGAGSGKTTLVNLLPRFYEYTQGSIQVDGVELHDYPRDLLRQQMGFVMQEPFLFSTTIRENITYGLGREVTDEEVYAAARAADVHDVIMSFPEGYNTLVGERGVTLSGGQKQRVTLARTIMRDPSLLILDDAMSAVDTETDESIRRALRQLLKGRTTFQIAHRVQSVMDADLILVLEHGRITQMGTHTELLKQTGGVYRRIYDLQSRIEEELEADLAKVTAVPKNGKVHLHELPQAGD